MTDHPTEPITNEFKLRAIREWQTAGNVHPLTCRARADADVPPDQNPPHDNLVGEERDGEVVLVCPTCGHVQSDVPPIVYKVQWAIEAGYIPPEARVVGMAQLFASS